tara:strand:- start:4852 stop:5193 length:342 start_codon:yes stop_codon:yes gene_type:complete
MQVANDDIFVKNIEKEIKCREKKLENMYINLKNKALENIFLESVLNEYYEYYKNLVNEKNKECHAFEEIYDYLDKINYESELTEEQIKELRYEQREILKKINNIKNDIQNILK